jgi:hypothetical protein
VEGVGGGLSDFFVKPYEAAKKDGTKGFFVGLGKGTLALHTKLGSCTSFLLRALELIFQVLLS